jgi:hypothetical protein
MPLTLEQYASYLDTRGLGWPAPPVVEPSRAKPHVVRLPHLRAVTWNIYGTLLAIAGGELFFRHAQAFVMDVALDKTVQEFNMWGSMSRKPGQPAAYLKQLYNNALDELSARSGTGAKNAETPAERIWEAVIKKLLQKDYKFDAGFFGSLNEYSVKVAYFFHASLQGTACYAEAADALQLVHKRGLGQGFIADAQSFTTVQLQRGLKKQDANAELGRFLDTDLSALSYKVGLKKPSERLFHPVLGELEKRGITPDQVLHIGSRVNQDIVPARRFGLRTALFTGDSASLQATPEQLKTPAGRPDLLLTELGQIADVLPRP